MNSPKKNFRKKAFTLIETLITICIITITISAVFFAKKTIKENNIKSLIMQIRKYDIALNNFTEKYHALPGDIADTATYGITETNSGGNGDNVITDSRQGIMMANGEISNFWMHLSKAKMLDEIYDGEEDSNAKIGNTFPISKVGEKIGIIAFGADGKTFYQIGFYIANSDRLYTNNGSLRTDEAFLFDKKIDDGNPRKGRVVAAGGTLLNTLENDECVKFNGYNESTVGPSCQLRIEAR